MMLASRYVVTVDGPVISDGAVVVEEGRISAVGRRRDLQTSQILPFATGGPPPRPPLGKEGLGGIIDYGDAVICPGFVNAHTHLELTLLAGRVAPSTNFTDWLERLTTLLRAEVSGRQQVQAAVRAGVTQSLSHGVTTIGDVTRHPLWTREVLAAVALRGVSFGEVIAIGRLRGLLVSRLEAAAPQSREQVGRALPAVNGARRAEPDLPKDHVGRVICANPPSPPLSRGGAGRRREEPANRSMQWRVGIAPHAPYTVEPDAMRACAARAAQATTGGACRRLQAAANGTPQIGAPICIHLLETPDEEPFTRRRNGPFADFLRQMGIWDDAIPISGCSPVELVASTGLMTKNTVLAHVNYATDADLVTIAATGASVAYCPRTHRAFGHPPHRFRDMLAAGINVCIGTDSLASNPSLSVLDELRFLRHEHPDLSADDLLAMGTLCGAEALGLADTTGSITVGKDADLVVLPVDAHGDRSAGELVLASADPPLAVYVEGVLRT